MQHVYCDSCGEKTFFGSDFPKRCSSCGILFGANPSTVASKPKYKPPVVVKKPRYVEPEYDDEEDDEDLVDLDIDKEAIRRSIAWVGEKVAPITLGEAQFQGPSYDPVGPRVQRSLKELREDVVTRKHIEIGK